MPFDLLIRNGLLFDGAGTAGMPGDVAIAGDCIIAIGPKLPADAGKPSTPRVSPLRPPSSTSKPIPTSPCRRVKRTEE
jgi:hypothetical protein